MMRKRLLFIGAGVFVLAVALCFALMHGADSGQPARAANAGTGDFFADFRQQREQTRAQEKLYLDELAADTSAGASARAQAQAGVTALVARMESELVMESLIKAKGFDDAAVLIGESGVDVVVCATELGQEELTQILEIVCRQGGVKAAQVSIIAAQ